jgi:hypothetical protein
MGLVIAATFFVSLSAAVGARSTDTASSALVAAGIGGKLKGAKIISTAAAEERVPVAISPLLTVDQMGRVKEVVLSNLGSFGANGEFTVCTDCPKNIIMKVDVAMKYEGELLAKFVRSGGMIVTVDKGIIEVENVPDQEPSKRFISCGKASCASVKVEGVNVKDLTARAVRLGYGNTGAGRRADGNVSGHHRRSLADWQKAGDKLRALALRRGECTCPPDRRKAGNHISLTLEDSIAPGKKNSKKKRRWGWAKQMANDMTKQAKALCKAVTCSANDVACAADQALEDLTQMRFQNEGDEGGR